MLLYTTTVLASLILAITVSAAGFANTCKDCRLIINKAAAGVMGCDCKKAGGTYTSTSIDLGNCFGNQNGNLVPQQGYVCFLLCYQGLPCISLTLIFSIFSGNFVATCVVEFLSQAPGSTLLLGVNCKKNDGSYTGGYAVNIGKLPTFLPVTYKLPRFNSLTSHLT
jgi:hypothetical protein